MATSDLRSRGLRFIAAVMVLVTGFALPASAHDESGDWDCQFGDHVYTKIRYTEGFSESYIDAWWETTKTHQTVGSVWVNRYHQPRDGNIAYYELREETSIMSNTFSWPGCED